MPNEVLALAPAVLGLTQAIIMAGFPRKLAPLVAIPLGVACAFVFVGGPWRDWVGWGLLAGLAAVGLYSAPKNVAEAVRRG